MRTKLLLTTAFVAALPALAQVYSDNVVGYINLSFGSGYTMFANQLNAGTGKNTLAQLMGPGLPDGTMAYKFDPTVPGNYIIASLAVVGTEWGWDADFPLAPGEGAFLRIPAGQTGTTTFVGEVMQGNLCIAVPKGWSIRSSMVPQEAVLALDTSMAAGTLNLGFPIGDGDVVYRWHNDTKTYSIHSFFVVGAESAWDDPPIIKVGESFFVKKQVEADWCRNFKVNQ